MTKRDYALANPELIKRVTAAFTDFGKAVAETPAQVKATIARVFPSLEEKTLDLIFRDLTPKALWFVR